MPLRLHFAGEDVVAKHGAQALQLEIARSAVHPADHFVHRALRLLDGQMRAGDHRAQEALHRLGLRRRECRIDDDSEPIGLAAIIGVSKHREVVGRNAAIPAN